MVDCIGQLTGGLGAIQRRRDLGYTDGEWYVNVHGVGEGQWIACTDGVGSGVDYGRGFGSFDYFDKPWGWHEGEFLQHDAERNRRNSELHLVDFVRQLACGAEFV